MTKYQEILWTYRLISVVVLAVVATVAAAATTVVSSTAAASAAVISPSALVERKTERLGVQFALLAPIRSLGVALAALDSLAADAVEEGARLVVARRFGWRVGLLFGCRHEGLGRGFAVDEAGDNFARFRLGAFLFLAFSRRTVDHEHGVASDLHLAHLALELFKLEKPRLDNNPNRSCKL